mgnify:CR=1 FL=1
MRDRIQFLINRLSERLWVRPLAACSISFAAVYLASLANSITIEQVALEIPVKTLETLLGILASSMLLIATFAVGSMVAAYANAGKIATPRSFRLIVADDVSQNALSVYIGAFIFSLVALPAVNNGHFLPGGRLALFALTALVFGVVILTFVGWVDRIARLGLLGSTVESVEVAADAALQRRRRSPRMGGAPVTEAPDHAQLVAASSVGHVQRIDLNILSGLAADWQARISVRAAPGAFVGPGRPLAAVVSLTGQAIAFDPALVESAFVIGRSRTFDDDPRFGLVVLSEIASRALSPAVNDPGSAVDVISALVRILVRWGEPLGASALDVRPGVEVPALEVEDVFMDAFRSIARDGAGCIEVGLRLQLAFEILAAAEGGRFREVAQRHAQAALARAEVAMTCEADLEELRGKVRATLAQ